MNPYDPREGFAGSPQLLPGEDIEFCVPPSTFELFQREMMRQIAGGGWRGRPPGTEDIAE
ncbi:hypothetical protein [Trinickia dinghuensis]|uniref:Uncharacterized protein n=1 Tax=Trinickia dinghuensis TaxID=2291023 RepID=A0A3D8K3N3_9BURK|nr:hypothetical protein [Trinickia dinghuensis]RDU99211.1 hypothetical protein DWV00_08785 [Trinickia dinghuensis]